MPKLVGDCKAPPRGPCIAMHANNTPRFIRMGEKNSLAARIGFCFNEFNVQSICDVDNRHRALAQPKLFMNRVGKLSWILPRALNLKTIKRKDFLARDLSQN